MMVTVAETQDLVGVADIARRLNVPRTTVSMWHSRRATTFFPLPVGEPAMGPVFEWDHIKRWHDQWIADEKVVERERV